MGLQNMECKCFIILHYLEWWW